ncbi:hypothetical protein EXIGLDRAFT_699306 [Exidia glandulosa HHB12029]|uniref:Condensation domain-containing protein n=1 Tax=Exidia glandulosa HHB12029 TaxID=1314781 RepID=A0A165MI01_EXIGL|nr:hypothetical protein EXIGLDRAFT_699306 [Exidia glandulosa HHB12029]
MTGTRRLRELGPFERFSLSRDLIGLPPIPVLAVETKNPISRHALSSAVKDLLRRYPLLGCCIPEASKPHPYWAANDDLDEADIIEVVQTATLSLSEVIAPHAVPVKPFDLRAGPLWHLTLHTSPASERTILLLAVHHVLSDGIGLRNLMVELLRLVSRPPEADIDSKLVRTDIPPILEDTMDTRPTWKILITVILQELILPRLPNWLRPAPRQQWPNPIPVNPYTQPARLTLVRISPEDVRALKMVGKARGVTTLHPLLLAVFYCAIWDAAGAPKEGMPVSSSTPFSERSAERGHPECTGNYVSSHDHAAPVSASTSFWTLARDIAAELKSPSVRRHAQGHIGMFAYIPSPDAVNERGQTGWEAHFGKELTDFNYRLPDTILVSNLGVLSGSDVEDVAWTQPIYGSKVFCIGLISAENGPLSITISWREGVISDAEVDRFFAAFHDQTQGLDPRKIRELGSFERYSLSRHLIGLPPIPVFAAELKDPVGRNALSFAVKELVGRYPLLRCCIPEANKPHPYWATNYDLDDAAIISVVHDSRMTVSEILAESASGITSMDLRSGPLWTVTLHSSNAAKASILVLAVHHVLSDGIGGKNLFSELLQLVSHPNPVVESTLTSSTDIAPTLEATVNVRPSWTVLLLIILKKLLLRRLPAWLRPKPRHLTWPTLRVSPLAQPTRSALIRVPTTDLLGLKRAGKEHGVPTLHPLLLAMSLYALWNAAGAPQESAYLGCTTPISERNAKLGHPTCTGNYVSSHEYFAPLSPDTSFWALARDIAASLASPAGRRAARGRMGMLGYVPSPDVVNERGQTGWEAFFEKEVTNIRRISHTIVVSNLGVLSGCDAEDVAWTQPVYPASEVLCMSVISSDNGSLNISVVWREGVISGAEADRFISTFELVAATVAQDSIPDEATFAKIEARA